MGSGLEALLTETCRFRVQPKTGEFTVYAVWNGRYKFRDKDARAAAASASASARGTRFISEMPSLFFQSEPKTKQKLHFSVGSLCT